tara:strand:+ start:857 stop:1060 length:204 start_codon:yes stop_codon:yes gene_type:complete
MTANNRPDEFVGKGFYDMGDHSPVAIMPDNQVNDDWHYKLQELVHERTDLCWHEDVCDWEECVTGGE